jgi:hypothetical protein
MSEFCVKCCEKEAQIELLRKEHYEEVKRLQKEIEDLTSHVESLVMDVAFYSRSITGKSNG